MENKRRRGRKKAAAQISRPSSISHTLLSFLQSLRSTSLSSSSEIHNCVVGAGWLEVLLEGVQREGSRQHRQQCSHQRQAVEVLGRNLEGLCMLGVGWVECHRNCHLAVWRRYGFAKATHEEWRAYERAFRIRMDGSCIGDGKRGHKAVGGGGGRLPSLLEPS